jgi:hypothetical protein
MHISNSHSNIKNIYFLARHWCFMPAILVMQEAEIRRISV